MTILALRTDKPEAEIYLITKESREEFKWQAHRELSSTLHTNIKDLLARRDKTIKDIEGVIVFKGPGSFTGLRIGITVANTIAHTLEIPIAGTDTDSWLEDGLNQLKQSGSDKLVLPEYGGTANITKPKK